MNKFFLFILLGTGIAAFSQSTSVPTKGDHGKKLLLTDTVIEKLMQLKDSTTRAIKSLDSQEIKEDFSRNMDGFIQLQNVQRTRQKKAAMLRIGIGVAFLAILIIGLKRKKKQRDSSSPTS